MNKAYKNPDHHPKGPWKATPLHAKSGSASSATFSYTFKNGVTFTPPAGTFSRYSAESLKRMDENDEIWFGKNGTAVPSRKTFLCDLHQQGVPARTVWRYDEVGHNHEARDEVKQFNAESVFATPKPEKLIERILTLGSNPRDLVLDSFLGSGTTIAVAQKMNRRWIGIELGEHCYTHCKPRIDMVIDGEQGGISKAVDWHGGGGYHFYELAPSLLVKNDKLPVYQINPTYTFEMLCEAICKIEGFKYKPQDVFHGHSSEKRFIHVTTEFVNAEYIRSLSQHLDEGQSLLVYATKIQSDMMLPDNIEVKKIPKDLLDKCNFESEVR